VGDGGVGEEGGSAVGFRDEAGCEKVGLSETLGDGVGEGVDALRSGGRGGMLMGSAAERNGGEKIICACAVNNGAGSISGLGTTGVLTVLRLGLIHGRWELVGGSL